MRDVYNDETSFFEEYKTKDTSVPIHTKNLQILANEVYKNMSPPIICEIFNRHEMNYELCNFAQFSVPYLKIAHTGTEIITYLGP